MSLVGEERLGHEFPRFASGLSTPARLLRLTPFAQDGSAFQVSTKADKSAFSSPQKNSHSSGRGET